VDLADAARWADARVIVPARPLECAGHETSRDGVALGGLCAITGAVVLVLVGGAVGYGYHRDELYFLVAGRHLAWGYADQGPITPAIARLMDSIAPGSLVALRIPSALLVGATVFATGLLAWELGASRRAQMLAAACAAVGSFALFVGHVLSTSTFDLFAWAGCSLIVARVLRTGEGWLWPVAGLVVGLALLNKPLIAFLVVALAVSILLVGPRSVFRDGGFWVGACIALALWSPWLVWQAMHGWPQLDVSSSIAHGGSGSSQPRWLIVPYQLLLVSPVLAPIWIAGLVALARRDSMRPFRAFAVSWVILVLLFTVTGGKPYYLAGLFPVLLAAGSIAADAWLGRGRARRRAALLGTAIVLSGIVSVTLALPLLPATDAGPVVAANADVGETIGWPQLVRAVARAYRRAPRRPVIFTSNYGEAGAVDRFGPALGLPEAYSGHNAFGTWGPPSDAPAPVVVVGVDRQTVRASFRGCRLVTRVDNGEGIDNDEQGTPVELCASTRQRWSSMWASLRHLG
jgi:4-amino-4-deoxy-L-arabinose transferase-like glycosyltransferase